MYKSVFDHSFPEEYLGFFQVWEIMNKIAKNIHVQVFVWI